MAHTAPVADYPEIYGARAAGAQAGQGRSLLMAAVIGMVLTTISPLYVGHGVARVSGGALGHFGFPLRWISQDLQLVASDGGPGARHGMASPLEYETHGDLLLFVLSVAINTLGCLVLLMLVRRLRRRNPEPLASDRG